MVVARSLADSGKPAAAFAVLAAAAFIRFTARDGASRRSAPCCLDLCRADRRTASATSCATRLIDLLRSDVPAHGTIPSQDHAQRDDEGVALQNDATITRYNYHAERRLRADRRQRQGASPRAPRAPYRPTTSCRRLTPRWSRPAAMRTSARPQDMADASQIDLGCLFRASSAHHDRQNRMKPNASSRRRRRS